MDNLWRGFVSVKGILLARDRVLLVKTRRGTWDLPGGKLEIGETPRQCFERECREELGVAIEPGELVACAMHPHFPDIFVIMIAGTYANQRLMLSSEHVEAKPVRVSELDQLGADLPAVYAMAIVKCARERPS